MSKKLRARTHAKSALVRSSHVIRGGVRIPVAACAALLMGIMGCALAAPMGASVDDVSAFQYRAAKWPSGTALIYHETQIGIDQLDSLTTLYMTPGGNLQALKLLRDDPQPMLVKARFDWAIDSVVHYSSWDLPIRAGDRPHAVADFDLAKRQLTISLTGAGSKIIDVASLPFHVHDFELMSLGAAMRFLKSPKSPFTFELVGLDRKDKLFFKDSGRILVEYVGLASCSGEYPRKCMDYDMLWAKSRRYFGRLQLDARNRDMVLMETVVPDEPGIVSLRLHLVGRHSMTPVEWRQTLENARSNPVYHPSKASPRRPR